MANKIYIERDVNITGDEQEIDKGLEEQTMVDPVIGVITPFKGERTLKGMQLSSQIWRLTLQLRNPGYLLKVKKLLV